tara:strand:- start:6188 stop:7033 length:846 start_codon:yes stop_codon:yes gene_type:complete
MGFQSARETINDLFTSTRDDVNKMLEEQWKKNNYVPLKEIDEKTDQILIDRNVSEIVYDTSWNTIYGKAKPMVGSLLPEDETLDSWLLLFLVNWNSFGKKLPSRINNTTRIIRNEYKKNTKRIYRDVFNATRSQDINSKIFGESLSPSVKKRYGEIYEKDKRRASEYLEEQFGKKAGHIADKKNRKLPNHFANRTTETEALTIRMDLSLESAGDNGKIKYVTISVKPQACSICKSYIGHKFPYGEQPHLLVHPNCRCDYIIHYVNGKTLTIVGSGRVGLIT